MEEEVEVVVMPTVLEHKVQVALVEEELVQLEDQIKQVLPVVPILVVVVVEAPIQVFMGAVMPVVLVLYFSDINFNR